MHTIYHYYTHNKLFKGGFLIGAGFGAGVAFMISGSIMFILGAQSLYNL